MGQTPLRRELWVRMLIPAQKDRAFVRIMDVHQQQHSAGLHYFIQNIFYDVFFL